MRNSAEGKYRCCLRFDEAEDSGGESSPFLQRGGESSPFLQRGGDSSPALHPRTQSEMVVAKDWVQLRYIDSFGGNLGLLHGGTR